MTEVARKTIHASLKLLHQAIIHVVVQPSVVLTVLQDVVHTFLHAGETPLPGQHGARRLDFLRHGASQVQTPSHVLSDAALGKQQPWVVGPTHESSKESACIFPVLFMPTCLHT